VSLALESDEEEQNEKKNGKDRFEDSEVAAAGCKVTLLPSSLAFLWLARKEPA
jgi:hypothetical protein